MTGPYFLTGPNETAVVACNYSDEITLWYGGAHQDCVDGDAWGRVVKWVPTMLGYATSALFSLITLVLDVVGGLLFGLCTLVTAFQVQEVKDLSSRCFRSALDDIKSATIGFVGTIVPEAAFQMRKNCILYSYETLIVDLVEQGVEYGVELGTQLVNQLPHFVSQVADFFIGSQPGSQNLQRVNLRNNVRQTQNSEQSRIHEVHSDEEEGEESNEIAPPQTISSNTPGSDCNVM